MRGKQIDWQDDWLRENVLKCDSYKDLTALYNKTFGTNVSLSGIKARCRNTLRIQKVRTNYRHFTQEQLKFLAEHYENMGNRELLELFNSTFHENRTQRSIKNFGMRYGLKVDETVRQKNRRAWLDKEESHRKTRKPGEMRIECGRPVMKDKKGNWKSAARVVWEKEHGPVPEGYVVTVLDGDAFNISQDNLACIPLKYLGLLSKHDLRSDISEITKTGIMICDLMELMREKKGDPA